MDKSQLLRKAAVMRCKASVAELRGLSSVAAGYRRDALNLEKLAKLATLGQVEETNVS